MQILYHIYPCVLLVLNLILCFLKCARNSGSVLHTHLRLCTCPLSLTPGCNVALVAAQMTVADAHVSAGGGVAHLPTAACALAQSGEGRHDVSSRVNTNCIFLLPFKPSEHYQVKWDRSTLKHCMWKNSPSVSMFMAAPFPSGWEHPEHNLFPLTHLRMYAHRVGGSKGTLDSNFFPFNSTNRKA